MAWDRKINYDEDMICIFIQRVDIFIALMIQNSLIIILSGENENKQKTKTRIYYTVANITTCRYIRTHNIYKDRGLLSLQDYFSSFEDSRQFGA